MSQVALLLVHFCTWWAQSPSRFNSLIALMMQSEWVEAHKLVLLTWTHRHALYMRFGFAELYGKIILCHQMCKGKRHSKAENSTTKITCMMCGSRWTVLKVMTDCMTTLGHHMMVKVLYPQGQYATEWKLPQPSSKFMQALHPTAPPVQESQAATPLMQKSQVVTPSLQNSQVPAPLVQKPQVTTPPVQMPQIATPLIQKPQVVHQSCG